MIQWWAVCSNRIIILLLYFICITVTELFALVHTPVITLRADPAFRCMSCLLTEHRRSITVIDRCWFTDNPWLWSHCGPHKEWDWLAVSHVLESKLHVALDIHLSLSIPPLGPCPSPSIAKFKNLYTHIPPNCRCDFVLLTGAQLWLHTEQDFNFSR